MCKRNGNPQRSGPTYLDHLKYDNSDPIAWTIEVCGKCHYQIDPNNKKILDRKYGRIPRQRPPRPYSRLWEENFGYGSSRK